jgi:hypothetical protein
VLALLRTTLAGEIFAFNVPEAVTIVKPVRRAQELVGLGLSHPESTPETLWTSLSRKDLGPDPYLKMNPKLL